MYVNTTNFRMVDARPLARVAKMLLPTRARAQNDAERMLRIEESHVEIRTCDAVLTVPLPIDAAPIDTTFVPLDVLDKAGRDAVVISAGAARIGRASIPLPCPSTTAETWDQLTDLPATAPETALPVFETDAATLLGALEAAAVAVSSEETRYYLNGVHIDAEGGRPVAVATDGHRLVAATLDAVSGPALSDGASDIIVPREALAALQYMLKEYPGAVRMAVWGAPLIAHAQIRCTGGWALTVRLIDASYPDWRRVMPSEQKGSWVVETAELASLVRDAKRFGPARQKGVVLKLGDGVAMAGEVSIDLGMTATFGDVPKQFGVNYEYLGDVVKVFGDAEIRASFKSAADPLLIAPIAAPEWGDLRMVLMPMRV